jgi:hypothetical protein
MVPMRMLAHVCAPEGATKAVCREEGVISYAHARAPPTSGISCWDAPAGTPLRAAPAAHQQRGGATACMAAGPGRLWTRCPCPASSSSSCSSSSIGAHGARRVFGWQAGGARRAAAAAAASPAPEEGGSGQAAAADSGAPQPPPQPPQQQEQDQQPSPSPSSPPQRQQQQQQSWVPPFLYPLSDFASKYSEVLRRAGVTLAMLAVMRAGMFIPLPGLDQALLTPMDHATEGERMIRALYGQVGYYSDFLFKDIVFYYFTGAIDWKSGSRQGDWSLVGSQHCPNPRLICTPRCQSC